MNGDSLHKEFIEGILREMTGNAVMAVATGRTSKGKLEIREFKWFQYPEQLDRMVAYAERDRNGDKRNVYLSPQIYGDAQMVNEKTKQPIPLDRDGDPQFSRGIHNALWAQTIYMDSDSCPPDAFRIQPSRHVNTSATHGHDYWFLTEPVPAADAAEVAHRITVAHKEEGCDPTGWSQNKLLRMPTVNTSYDQENPYVVNYHDTGELYDILDISGAYDNVEIRDVLPALQIVDAPEIADLPDMLELMSRIPATERRLNELINKKPKLGPDGWRSEQRFALLLDLQRFGFSPLEAATIAYWTPSAEKWRSDDRGISGLLGEALKAEMVIKGERGQDDLVVEESPLERKSDRVKILKDHEREWFDNRQDMVVQYCEYVRPRVPAYNGPYHHINAWTLLSLKTGAYAVIPKEGTKMGLNLYTMTIGTSSSGKSEAWDMALEFISALFPMDNPDIGGNHSENGLIERLIDRNGKSSLTWSDEADGVLATWMSGGWATGTAQTVTKLYEGGVPQVSRVGRKELQIHDATTTLNSWMAGTPEGMFKILDEGMFKSGFLARQVWAIGEDIEVTEETMRVKQSFGDSDEEYSAMPKYMASQLARSIGKATASTPFGQNKMFVHLSDQAAARFEKAKWAIHKHFEKFPNQEIYKTAVRRMYDIIWKAAVISAVSQGRNIAIVDDIVTALGSAEVWLDSLVYVANGIADSAHSRACDDIEAFIMSREGREAESSAIYRFRKSEDSRMTENYLTSLLKQKRIVERQAKMGSVRYYRIRENKKEDDS